MTRGVLGAKRGGQAGREREAVEYKPEGDAKTGKVKPNIRSLARIGFGPATDREVNRLSVSFGVKFVRVKHGKSLFRSCILGRQVLRALL